MASSADLALAALNRTLVDVFVRGVLGADVRLVAVCGRGEDAGESALSRRVATVDVVARRRREQDERWRSTDMRRLRRRPGVGSGGWHGDAGGETSGGGRGSLMFTVRLTSFSTIRGRVDAGMCGEEGAKGDWGREARFVRGRGDRGGGGGVVVASDLRSRSSFSRWAAAIWSRKGCNDLSWRGERQ